MYRIAIPTLLLAVAACSGPAPGNLADKAAGKAVGAVIEAASDGKVKDEGDRLVVEDGNGQEMQLATSREGLPPPAWWPQDIYLPEGAVISQVAQNEGNNVLSAMVPRPGAVLNDEIEQAMHVQGWKTLRSSRAASGGGMAAFRKEGREVSVLVSPTRKGEQAAMTTYHLRSPRAQ